MALEYSHQQRKNDFPNDKSLAGKRNPTFVLHLRHIYLAYDDAGLRTRMGVHERQPTAAVHARSVMKSRVVASPPNLGRTQS
jgi:hypothetical protein